ncbi:MAG: hypothetical protein U0S13_08160 [Mycobacterium sp.]
MAPKKRGGRAAAEAAYTELLKDARQLVGDVGATYEAFTSALAAAIAEQKRYEEARAAAVKAGAVSNDQLDAMGYRKTPKLPALPAPGDDEPAKPASAPKAAPRGEVSPSAGPAPQPAMAGSGVQG